MSSSASSSSIQVFSQLDTEHTRALIHRIIDVDGSSAERKTTEDSFPWWIKNKYYTAQVVFHLHHMADISDATSLPESIHHAPAVMVIFSSLTIDPSVLAHFDHGWPHLDIKLAITCANGPLPSNDSEMAEDVCLQHGFEFVDALALPPTGGSDGDASDDDELESRGVERVREALQVHMWPPSTPEPSDACPPDKLPNCNTEASQFEDDFTPFIDSRSSLQTPAEEEEELDDFDSLTRMIGQLQAARTHALSLGDDDGKRREFAEAATRRFLRQFEDDHV